MLLDYCFFRRDCDEETVTAHVLKDRLSRAVQAFVVQSRGAVIDEPALIEALENDKIRGAALDVFTVEPLPAGHAFYRLQNVLVSPHTADHVQDFVHLAVECFLDNMRLFQTKQPLQNIVDKRAGY